MFSDDVLRYGQFYLDKMIYRNQSDCLQQWGRHERISASICDIAAAIYAYCYWWEGRTSAETLSCFRKPPIALQHNPFKISSIIGGYVQSNTQPYTNYGLLLALLAWSSMAPDAILPTIRTVRDGTTTGWNISYIISSRNAFQKCYRDLQVFVTRLRNQNKSV